MLMLAFLLDVRCGLCTRAPPSPKHPKNSAYNKKGLVYTRVVDVIAYLGV